jgi:hypothetical protein
VEDNIKVDLKEIRCQTVGWIEQGRDTGKCSAFLDRAMKHLVP